MALSKVDLANQVENQLPQNLVANNLPFRNIIINGDMSIAQRSTGSETITGTGYYTVDRFIMNVHPDFASIGTMAQNLDSLTPPDYFNNYVGLQIDTATTPSGDVYYNFRQQVEGNNIGNLKFGTSSAKTITISFWVRSTLTGNFSFSLRNQSSDRSFVTTYNIATANTWEKKTITIQGDTSGTWGLGNGIGLTVNWGLGNSTGSFSTSTLNSWQEGSKTGATTGVDLVATANAKWYITGVQLEVGSAASDFEFLPVDVNLQRCLRYYEQQNYPASQGANFALCVSQAYNTTSTVGTFQYKVRKRTSPTISASGSSIQAFNAGAGGAGGSISFDNISEDGTRIIVSGASGLVAGNASGVFFSDAILKINAEL